MYYRTYKELIRLFRLLLVSLGIYMIIKGPTKKYLAFPYGFFGSTLVYIGGVI